MYMEELFKTERVRYGQLQKRLNELINMSYSIAQVIYESNDDMYVIIAVKQSAAYSM